MTGPPAIVLLESDSNTRQFLEVLLIEEGFEVWCADSLEAMAKLSDVPSPSLLLTNLLLNDGRATDIVADWVKSGRFVIGMTDTYLGPTNRQYWVEHHGLADLIEQPIEGEVLAKCLRDQLGENHPDESEPTGATFPSAQVSLIDFVPRSLDLDGVALGGLLADTDIVAILSRIARDQLDGALMLQDGQVKKLVFFEQGVPVGIKSNLVDEFLGQMLVNEGVITQEICQASVEEISRTRRHQGETLLTMGFVTQEMLNSALTRQFLLKYQQLLTWSKGAFKIKDTPVPAAYYTAPRSHPVQLMWDAIFNVRPLYRVHPLMERIMSCDVVWTGGAFDLSPLVFQPEAASVFERVNGDFTVEQAIDASTDPETATLFLYMLTAIGAVRFRS